VTRSPLPQPAPLFSQPAYWAVIFTSVRTEGDDGYAAMAGAMEALATEQAGYLGIESARGADGLGITVSYWLTEEDARAWKRVAAHLEAQRLGRDRWYASYRVRVAQVEREYGFEAEAEC
jgi:heme-degrading monooxygenase HmoA